MVFTGAKYISAAEDEIEVDIDGKISRIPKIVGNRVYDEMVNQTISITSFSAVEITLDQVRELRKPKFGEIDMYYLSRPPPLPTGVTQAEMDTYQDDLRNLPSTIDLTGVTTEAGALALFPAFPT